jgi:uncharacterized repeat protein (TIGR03847 family)
MGPSFRFDRVDALVPGAVGPPGQRVFYLQARSGARVVSFKVEKQQVAALAERLVQLAAALGASEPDRDVAGLIEPVEAEWTVAGIALGVDEDATGIVVTLEELVDVPEPDEDFTEADVDELLDAAEATFGLSPAQALAFGEAAAELVAAGRPACRLCGRPIGPEGHACPRWN